MTDSALPPDAFDEEALRKRLMNRIALAGVAVVALLGGLAIVDSMYVSPHVSSPKVSVQGESVAPVEAIAIQPAVVSSTTAATPEPPEPPMPQAIPTLPPPAPEESSPPTVSVAGQVRPARSVDEAKGIPPAVQGYVVQMGVFNNTEHAQELLAKLKQAGVPAQIESRVQVGPFKSKAEADSMRAKLKALGMDSGLVMPLRK